MGVKYIAGGKDISGDVIEIHISKDGYIDDPIELKMGSSPYLRMDNGGRIKGTSLEFTLLSETVGALTDLYTTDAYGLKVQLFKNSVVIWTGYVLREQYGEDYIEPPYAISVTATDGLGLLKDIPYISDGYRTAIQLFFTAFNKIHQSLELVVFSVLSAKVGGFLTRQWLDTAFFDCTDFADDYYEMLEKLLETINAYITQRNNKWVIERTPDIIQSGLRYSSSGFYLDQFSPITSIIKPIGSLALVIEPSKKDIEITSYKNFPDSILKNNLFETSLYWHLTESSYSFADGVNFVNMLRSYETPVIYQDVALGTGYTYILTIDFASINASALSKTFNVKISKEGYYLSSNGWVTTDSSIQILTTLSDIAYRERIEIKFRSAPNHVGSLDTYRIAINGINDSNVSLRIYEASLAIEAPREKYLDVTINSNATQDADEYGIHVSDEEGVPNSLNVWKISGNATSEWQHISAATTSSFNIMMARDIISNHLVTRVRLSGSVEEIGDIYYDSYGDRNFLAESYDYDLLNKIANIELIEFSQFYDISLGEFSEGEYTTGDSSSSGRSSLGGSSGVALGETEFTAYRGDRGKIAFDHSQDSSLHFDTSSGTGKITKAQGASLVTNLGDGSAIATQVDANKTNITANTTAISTINTTLGNYAAINGDITKPFSASQLTTSKIILNGVELTIEAV